LNYKTFLLSTNLLKAGNYPIFFLNAQRLFDPSDCSKEFLEQ